MKILRIVFAGLLLCGLVRATPTTIDEYLQQDQQPRGTVTIIETEDCCEDKDGIPWWPFLFAGAVPLVFIDGDDKPPNFVPPILTPGTSSTPEPVPEPPTLTLGLVSLAGIVLLGKRAKHPRETTQIPTLLRLALVLLFFSLWTFVYLFGILDWE